MISPDILTGYKTGKKQFVLRESVLFNQMNCFFSFNKIESDTVKRQFCQILINVTHIAEVRL